MRCNPRRVFTGLSLLNEGEAASIRVEKVTGDELRESTGEDGKFDHTFVRLSLWIREGRR